jgi:hypothetical protein
LFTVMLETGESLDLIMSNVMALLPVPKFPAPDKDSLPPPAVFQVFRKPYGRSDRKLVKNFEIISGLSGRRKKM